MDSLYLCYTIALPNTFLAQSWMETFSRDDVVPQPTVSTLPQAFPYGPEKRKSQRASITTRKIDLHYAQAPFGYAR
jgi:hypothetical protein